MLHVQLWQIKAGVCADEVALNDPFEQARSRAARVPRVAHRWLAQLARDDVIRQQDKIALGDFAGDPAADARTDEARQMAGNVAPCLGAWPRHRPCASAPSCT